MIFAGVGFVASTSGRRSSGVHTSEYELMLALNHSPSGREATMAWSSLRSGALIVASLSVTDCSEDEKVGSLLLTDGDSRTWIVKLLR
jgi:hypothetical protein